VKHESAPARQIRNNGLQGPVIRKKPLWQINTIELMTLPKQGTFSHFTLRMDASHVYQMVRLVAATLLQHFSRLSQLAFSPSTRQV